MDITPITPFRPPIEYLSPVRGLFNAMFISVLFVGFGVLLLGTFLGDFSWNKPSLTRGIIVETSQSPHARFEYKGKTYTIESNRSSTCNGGPCSHAGDATWILVDGTNPQYSVYLSDVLLLLIFPLVGIFVGIFSFFSWRKNVAFEKTLQEIRAFGRSVSAIIVDVDMVYHRKSRSGYKYICRDPKTMLEYESKEVYDDTIALGSTVQVYINPEKYPGISYVDLDSALAGPPLPEQLQIDSGTSANASLASIISYQQSKATSVAREYQKDTLPPVATVIFLLFLIVLFGAMAIFLSGMAWLVVAFLAVVLYNTIRYMIRENKKKRYASTGIVSVGTIQKIEKYGFKMVALGYIPPEEKTMLDMQAIQSGKSVEIDANIGYQYYFVIDVGGRQVQSDKLATPFPKKAKVGAKVEVLFRDITMQEYVVDAESIDRLN